MLQHQIARLIGLKRVGILVVMTCAINSQPTISTNVSATTSIILRVIVTTDVVRMIKLIVTTDMIIAVVGVMVVGWVPSAALFLTTRRPMKSIVSLICLSSIYVRSFFSSYNLFAIIFIWHRERHPSVSDSSSDDGSGFSSSGGDLSSDGSGTQSSECDSSGTDPILQVSCNMYNSFPYD